MGSCVLYCVGKFAHLDGQQSKLSTSGVGCSSARQHLRRCQPPPDAAERPVSLPINCKSSLAATNLHLGPPVPIPDRPHARARAHTMHQAPLRMLVHVRATMGVCTMGP